MRRALQFLQLFNESDSLTLNQYRIYCNLSQERKRHININLFWPVTRPGDRGVSRPGGQGSKFYVLSSEPKEHKSFFSGYPTGRTGDRGDRKKFYVQKVLCAFSATY